MIIRMLMIVSMVFKSKVELLIFYGTGIIKEIVQYIRTNTEKSPALL